MKLLYRGLATADGRVKRTGCASCGGVRPNANSSVRFQDEYTFIYEGRTFRFRVGHTYDVPEDLARLLLTKHSFLNGRKLYAFEPSDGDGEPKDDNPLPV